MILRWRSVSIYEPDMSKILAECFLEVLLDYVGGVFLGGVSKRKSFFPWQLGGEPAGETAGIAAMLAHFSLSFFLVGERQVEEVVHVTVSVGDELSVNSVIDDEKEAMFSAGFVDELTGFCVGDGVAGKEAAKVDERDGEFSGGVGAGLLVVRPDELGGDVGLVAVDGGVEN